MKGFIKVWWHCLWRMTKDLDVGGHRMSKIYFGATNGKKSRFMFWECSCKIREIWDTKSY